MSYQIRTYASAKGFCQSAIAIVGSQARFQAPDDTTFVMGFHHLVGFAVELYLKAFLAEMGVEEGELRRPPYGHNLGNLLEKASELGLNSTAAPALCGYLSKHGTFEYRYISEDSQFTLIPIKLLFELLTELDSFVDVAIGASASRGREPSEGWTMTDEIGAWRLPQSTS